MNGKLPTKKKIEQKMTHTEVIAIFVYHKYTVVYLNHIYSLC